jgi:hypothetical protein
LRDFSSGFLNKKTITDFKIEFERYLKGHIMEKVGISNIIRVFPRPVAESLVAEP